MGFKSLALYKRTNLLMLPASLGKLKKPMPPSHMTLQNNQSFSFKPGKALSVIVEASGYPNAPTRTCPRDLCVGFNDVVFMHVHCFIYQAMIVG